MNEEEKQPEKAAEEEKKTEDQKKDLTFDDVLNENKSYQSEFDKRIEKALKTARENWEVEVVEKQKEAERLAKMTAEEQLKEKEKTLMEKEALLNKKELVNQTRDLLISENLPSTFAENIVSNTTTAEEIKQSVKEIKEKFNLEVEATVKNKLSSTTPKQSELKPNSKNYELRKAMKLENKGE